MRITGNPPSGGKKPGTPTIGTATAGSGSATVAYTAPSYTGKGGAVTYRATSSPGGLTGTGASPITVSGLTNGTAYTFTVTAETSYGVNSDSSSASNSITPSVPSDFYSIATFTGGTNIATFSSIPQTYKHLQIRGMTKGATGTAGGWTFNLTFNGNTTLNYYWHGIFASLTTQTTANGVAGGAINTATSILPRAGQQGNGAFIIDIHNYSRTSNNKMCKIWGGFSSDSSYSNIIMQNGVLINTSAISSLSLQIGSGNFDANTSIALYGIG